VDLFRLYFAEAFHHRIRSKLKKIRFIRSYFAQKASGYSFQNKKCLLIFSIVSWPFSSLNNKKHLLEIVAWGLCSSAYFSNAIAFRKATIFLIDS